MNNKIFKLLIIFFLIPQGLYAADLTEAYPPIFLEDEDYSFYELPAGETAVVPKFFVSQEDYYSSMSIEVHKKKLNALLSFDPAVIGASFRKALNELYHSVDVPETFVDSSGQPFFSGGSPGTSASCSKRVGESLILRIVGCTKNTPDDEKYITDLFIFGPSEDIPSGNDIFGFYLSESLSEKLKFDKFTFPEGNINCYTREFPNGGWGEVVRASKCLISLYPKKFDRLDVRK